MRLLASALLVSSVSASNAPSSSRTVFSLNKGWKFELQGKGPIKPCPQGTWTQDASNVQVLGLTETSAVDETTCAEHCCADDTCVVYQFCNSSDCGNGPPQQPACWIGKGDWPKSQPSKGWIGRAREQPPPPQCPEGTWTIDLNDKETLGLTKASVHSETECANACCNDPTCSTYQWCNTTDCHNVGCWIGEYDPAQTNDAKGWVGGGRSLQPSGSCADEWCSPKTDDSEWRTVRVPHDFVVEGTFSPDGDKSHGYLPYGVGFYRKHLSLPAAERTDASDKSYYLQFDGVQALANVYLDGVQLGTHASGYTPFQFLLNDTAVAKLKGGASSVLAVEADATKPDGWWYDGGGIYRNVRLVAVPKVHLSLWGGAYTPALVTGKITNLTATEAQVHPSVTVINTGSATASSVSVSCSLFDAAGKNVGQSSNSSVTVPVGQNTTVALDTVTIQNANLWHPVPSPYLYSATCSVEHDGVVDSTEHAFGIRKPVFDVDHGLILNDQPVKILGTANHQDFAGLGVAIPDHLQEYRVTKLAQMGVNAWRTAHNAPNPALLDAADRNGFLVWDENHRNGQDDELTRLVLRDRNHPSIIIWSICNEKLCSTSDTANDGNRMHDLFHSLDPLGQRVVSANYNPWVKFPAGKPLDLQGVDYATSSYDKNHEGNPVPLISSETSSAVSDRAIFKNDPAAGHVTGYDTEHPGWGQTAEGAWGGIGQPNGQGILTRDFMSGGFTWTGWDYKGEPTPDSWPDINSHFGILDECGFEKDRFYWYQAWFKQYGAGEGMVHLLPHWNWNASSAVDVWAFSNAAQVELFVNNVSQGKKNQTPLSHVEWDSVPFTAGSLSATAYDSNGAVVATQTVETAGAPAQLSLSIRDNIGAELQLNCDDVALVQVAVQDSQGRVVPTASNNVTLEVQGAGVVYRGGGNGDPAEHTSDKSPSRPAFGGLLLGVFGIDPENGQAGTATITASSPGLKSASVTVKVAAGSADATWWCPQYKEL